MQAPEPVRKERPAEQPPGTLESLLFVGRRKEISRLCQLHAQQKNVLILGAAGMGKSALVQRIRQELSLLVSSRSAHLGEICDGLEPQVNLGFGELRLLQRKQLLRDALWRSGKAIVFDGAGWTTPKVTSFIESIAPHAPVWICVRSEHPWDMGHIWPFLVRFERVELHPFHLKESQELVEAAVRTGKIPPSALAIIDWLHRRSGGSPLILRELFEELTTGKYDLSSTHALKRLDLDRRIHEVFPNSNTGAQTPQQKPI